VVIDNLDFMGVAIAPLEADAPLVVDTDAVLAGPVAAQAFESVSRWDPEIVKALSVVQHPQFPPRHLLNIAR
jgi:hypothetical protein